MLIRHACLFLSLLVAFASSSAAAVETLPTAQVEAGRKATVRTVFSGTQIETFEAEILGTLRGGRAGGDIILARATAGRAMQTGIAQGMSGSPVYVEGKLIGALALSWPFAREPIFGITPIEEMLAVLAHPIRSQGKGSAGPSGAAVGGLTTPGFRGLAWSRATRSEAAGRPDESGTSPREPDFSVGAPLEPANLSAGLTRLALPVAASGLAPGTLEIAQRWFAPHGLTVAAGGNGRVPSAEAAELEPGSAVAVDLMRGDLRFTVIGTLTWRDGERLLMFGHPIFQSGEVRLPLAAASITTVLPSALSSFKIGNGGHLLGTLTQDRRAGAAGRLGESPALMPVSVAIRSGDERPLAYRFESIEDRTLAPTLVAIATLNSLLESGGTGSNQTVRWSLALHHDGVASPTVLSDVAAGDQPVFETASGIVSPLAFLYGNPYGVLALDSVTVAIDVAPGRALFNLIEARVLDSVVRPGGSARVQCVIERWRGARESRTLVVTVPEEAPDGRYALWLGGGDELTRYESKRLPGRYRPTSLADAWRRLGASRGNDAIYAALYASAPEVTLDGRDYPELPLSAAAVLLSPDNPGATPRRGLLAKLDEVRVPVDGALGGELQTTIEVDSQAP